MSCKRLIQSVRYRATSLFPIFPPIFHFILWLRFWFRRAGKGERNRQAYQQFGRYARIFIRLLVVDGEKIDVLPDVPGVRQSVVAVVIAPDVACVQSVQRCHIPSGGRDNLIVIAERIDTFRGNLDGGSCRWTTRNISAHVFVISTTQVTDCVRSAELKELAPGIEVDRTAEIAVV